MALGTLAAVALGVSAAAGASQALSARKTRKEQERRLNQQALEAKEAAAVRNVRDSTGADVVLGSDTDTDTINGVRKRKRSASRGSVLSTAGGVSAAGRIGL